ncbi:translation initiation factor IF-3 [Pigmentibacter ruber]|uniref:translation initiation factor IF-3 n=1 Tax=Pigmentibacter ruber TaxID=2683196 RepID=UPI00192E600A|nr:translation initiation factor IF-3 [Pigmentibacter ruber]
MDVITQEQLSSINKTTFIKENAHYMRPMGNQQSRTPTQDGPRINDRIKAPEVRLISDTGEQVGVLPIREALSRAEELGLDLVEVSPDAKPPVCRLIDYGKFKYQQSKKAQEAKKKQVVIEVKEINLTPNTERHDIETKQNHIKRWIAEKARVRVGVKFRGREMSHVDLGYKALQELMAGLEDIVVQESAPRLEGRRLVVTLLPKSEKV